MKTVVVERWILCLLLCPDHRRQNISWVDLSFSIFVSPIAANA